MSSEKCRLKIRSLEQKYKRNVKHNNKSGNSPIFIEGYIEEAFGKTPAVQTSITPLESQSGSQGKGPFINCGGGHNFTKGGHEILNHFRKGGVMKL